jgi:hypothetical protein
MRSSSHLGNAGNQAWLRKEVPVLFSKRKLRFSGRSGAFFRSADPLGANAAVQHSFGRVGDQLAGDAANRLSWPAPDRVCLPNKKGSPTPNCQQQPLLASARDRMPTQAGQMIASWVCPKQYLALYIKAAFSRYKAGVIPARIVERAVPGTALSPFAPGDIIAILAVGISRFPGRTKDALRGVAWTVDDMPGHCGPCQNRSKYRGGADQPEVCHAFLL